MTDRTSHHIAGGVNRYELGEFIANGGYSQVYEGSLKVSPWKRVFFPANKKYAIKICKIEAGEFLENGNSAVNKSNQLHHIENELLLCLRAKSKDYVVRYIESFMGSGNEIWNVFEHVDFSLPQVVEEMSLNEDQICSISYQALEGIRHIHRCGIIHMDIKFANLLLSRNGKVKICDFGLSKMLEVGNTLTVNKPVGSPSYIAPELLLECSELEIDHRVDIWSLGVVICKLLTGNKRPYYGNSQNFGKICWSWYEESTSYYFEKLLGKEIAKQILEYSAYESINSAKDNLKTERQKLFILMYKCLLPLPTSGPGHNIERSDTMIRPSSENLVRMAIDSTKAKKKKRVFSISQLVRDLHLKMEKGDTIIPVL